MDCITDLSKLQCDLANLGTSLKFAQVRLTLHHSKYIINLKGVLFMENIEVAISKCEDYSEANVKAALTEALGLLDILKDIKDGSKVAIKANLVSFMSPEKAATTHPQLLIELCKILREKNCEITVGDSPGGQFNASNLNKVYKATGMQELTQYGVKLNENFDTETVKFPEGKVCKEGDLSDMYGY